MSYKTRPTPPVVLLVFNRPEMTRKMLAPLKAARPEVVLIVADGPRDSHPQDRERCAAVRALLEEEINWQPRILTNYSPVNLGCRARVSSGLTWAFEQVEEAIILEDDCVADPTFFPYCAELLEYYRNDGRIGAITGDNYQAPGSERPTSYCFSRYPHCWGWATWRRAWKYFDNSMAHWPRLKAEGWLNTLFPDPLQTQYWTNIFDWVYRGEINSWAYPWTYSCWTQHLLSVNPSANLVSNIGSGPDATHTSDPETLLGRPVFPMKFPLVHPPNFAIDFPADDYSQLHVFGLAHQKGIWRKLKRKIFQWAR